MLRLQNITGIAISIPITPVTEAAVYSTTISMLEY